MAPSSLSTASCSSSCSRLWKLARGTGARAAALGAGRIDRWKLLPLYLGDDTSDEDAFRAVAGRGLGVLVAEEPRPSAAAFRLRDTVQVRAMLEGLARLLRPV